ncbi:MAG: hypothetical protein ACRDUW_23425, partial [Pseudonocardiaceae bacterium]
MSAPASPYRFFGPQPRHLRRTNRFGNVTFTLGLLVAFGLVVYATWLGVAALAGVEGSTQRVGATGAPTQLAAALP